MSDPHPHDQTHYELHTDFGTGFTKRETFDELGFANAKREALRAAGYFPELFVVTFKKVAG